MSITPRTFLETAGATLAASAVRGAGDTPVRVAVIGTGGRGSDLLRALTTIEGLELVGVCDDYAPHLEQGAKYAGPQAKMFSDYRRLLDEVKPQAVVIAVPLYLHYAIAADCLRAGCDVFLEKTMCYTVDEAKKLAAQVATSKRVFQVGLQRRANAIYKPAQAMVAAGVIGQVVSLKAQWHRNNSWRRPIPVPKGDASWLKLERKLNWREGGLLEEIRLDDAANNPQRCWGLGICCFMTKSSANQILPCCSKPHCTTPKSKTA